ncbi:hypothetical protein D3C81_1914160 [compost metagenome]
MNLLSRIMKKRAEWSRAFGSGNLNFFSKSAGIAPMFYFVERKGLFVLQQGDSFILTSIIWISIIMASFMET